MKVLMVTMSMDIGGAETHILELCRAFSKRGISVSVASAGGNYVHELKKCGIPHLTLPLNKKTPRALLLAFRGLEAYIRREKFDIVHAHARIPAFLCGRLRKRCGFHFVTTDHLDFRLNPVLKRLTDWGEFTFAVSEDLRGYLLRNFHLDPSRIALTVNGIDTDHFSPKAANPLPQERLYEENRAVVLHISRLEKHLSLCVRALMGAAERLNGKITLAVLGDGSYAPVLKAEALVLNKKLGYPAVTFAGATTDVLSYIAAADIVVSPSRAAMEAMACGKPTVVCGSQGYGGIFNEKIAEKAVDSNFCFRGSRLPTADLLARDIETLLSMNATERKALGDFARDFICRRYSVDVMAQTQLDGYAKLTVKQTERTCDVLICGYYGYGNMGDESMLAVIIRELRRQRPDIRLCALSASPEKTAARFGIDTVGRFDPERISKQMDRSGLLLFGGGNLLQDKTSTHSLLYYTHILRMAKKRGLNILIYANGIGPLLKEENKKRAGEALSLADTVSLRDRESFLFAEKCCPEKTVRLTFDPAVLTEQAFFPIPDQNYFVAVPKKTVPDSTELTVRLIRAVAEKTGWKPILVSMYDKEDLGLVRKIALQANAEIREPQRAEELITLFASSMLVISSRLHGLVYATAAACPMVGVSDDGKLFSYLEYIGFGNGAPVPCGIHVSRDAEIAVARVTDLLNHRETCQRKLAESLPAWKTLARSEIDEVLTLLNAHVK